MVEILPAILARTIGEYHQKLKAIEPLTDWVQIDIVDNVYARNQTIDVKDVASIRTSLKMEIQLMVEEIEDFIDPFIKLKPGRIIVPVESAREPIELVQHLQQHGVPFGFSLEPKTPVERMQHLVDKVDHVLLLAVHPGFSGQHFAHNVLQKIRDLKVMRPDLIIEVDGGIELGTARKCAEAGANILVAGSWIFQNDTIDGATYNEKVRNALEALKEAVADVIPEQNI